MSFTGFNEKKVDAAREREKDSGHLIHVNITMQKWMPTWDYSQVAHAFTIPPAETPPRLAVPPLIWNRKPQVGVF